MSADPSATLVTTSNCDSPLVEEEHIDQGHIGGEDTMKKWKNHNLKVWGPLLEEATKAVKASKTPISLWQLHHQIQNKEIGGPAVYKYSPWNPVFPKTGTEEVMGEATWNHVKNSQAQQILLGGKIVYVPPPILLDIKRLMFTELSKAITADTEVVLETGSGWSRNIFYLTETGLLRNKNIRVKPIIIKSPCL